MNTPIKQTPEQSILKVGNVTLDRARRVVIINEQPAQIKSFSYGILELLILNAEQVVRHETIAKIKNKDPRTRVSCSPQPAPLVQSESRVNALKGQLKAHKASGFKIVIVYNEKGPKPLKRKMRLSIGYKLQIDPA